MEEELHIEGGGGGEDFHHSVCDLIHIRGKQVSILMKKQKWFLFPTMSVFCSYMKRYGLKQSRIMSICCSTRDYYIYINLDLLTGLYNNKTIHIFVQVLDVKQSNEVAIIPNVRTLTSEL
jgi:hypothetical protein